MKNWCRTKVIATLGPSASQVSVLRRIISLGADVVRFNFAHGNHLEHAERIRNARRAAREVGHTLALLQDLPGPKLRVGRLHQPIEVKAGDAVQLRAGAAETDRRTIPIAYPYLLKDVKAGHAVFIADGAIRMTVEAVRDGALRCQVMNGGTIKTGNGVNLPLSSLTLKPFTREDARHLAFGLSARIDLAGVSFVETGEDIDRVRAFVRRRGHNLFLIAKIERRLAINNLESIVEKADGIMVARGDLGVEVPYSELPGLQQRIVAAARRHGKPVIVATQVLESMLNNPRPTRAEATDVANAVWGGADAVMLSGETSIGKYPVEAVRALNTVIASTESTAASWARDPETLDNEVDVIAMAACRLAEKMGAKVIAVPSLSGQTAMRVSRFRPSTPIIALAADERVRRRLTLFWGVQTIDTKRIVPHEQIISVVRGMLVRHRLVRRGDTFVVLSGPWGRGDSEKGLIRVLTA